MSEKPGRARYVLKTQMQEGETQNMKKLIKTIYKNYGIKGFWRGSFARILRVAPGQGVMFFTYEGISNIFNKFTYP